MTTKEKANCDQCGSSFQPKRTNKTGPRFCGATCRQRAHRRNGQQRHGTSRGRPVKSDIPRIVSNEPDVWKRLTVQLGMRPEAAKAKRPSSRLEMVEYYVCGGIDERERLVEEVARLEERVMQDEQRLRRERERVDKYQDWWAEDRKVIAELLKGGGRGLTEAEWNKLNEFNDQQLRQWVKVGEVMERKGHDNPMRNASKWVEGNSLELSEKAEA